MSKRYGRNQRRKHREAIELLNEAVSKREYELQKLNNQFSNLKNQMEDWNDEIINLLGIYSAFKKEVLELAIRYFEEIRYLPEPMKMASVLSYNSPLPDFYTPTPIKLIQFLTSLSDEDLIHFRRIVKLKLNNGQQLAYAINIDHIQHIKKDKEFIKYLSLDIAKKFAAMIK